jgi:hypothetical protein
MDEQVDVLFKWREVAVLFLWETRLENNFLNIIHWPFSLSFLPKTSSSPKKKKGGPVWFCCCRLCRCKISQLSISFWSILSAKIAIFFSRKPILFNWWHGNSIIAALETAYHSLHSKLTNAKLYLEQTRNMERDQVKTRSKNYPQRYRQRIRRWHVPKRTMFGKDRFAREAARNLDEISDLHSQIRDLTLAK